jgi:alpha-1,2-mannosyltransferase
VCALVGVVAVVLAVVPRHPWHNLFDLQVYQGAARWWTHGRPLYDFRFRGSVYGFTYPPFAGLLMAPMGVLPVAVVLVGHMLLNVAVLVGLTRWLVVPLARRHGWPLPVTWIAAVPLLYVLEPVRETVGYGQVNLFLLALVLADGAALRRGSRWAGVGIGLAAAVKLTPALFVPYLLLTGRRRAAGVAAGTAAAATLLAAAVAPETSWRYWTRTLWETDRVGRTDKTGNQSLLGGLARLADPQQPSRALWAVLVVVLLVVAFRRAARAARAGDELAGLTLVGLTASLVSPISWTHHLVWVAPALVVLVDVAAGRAPAEGSAWWWRRRPRPLATVLAGSTALVFVASTVWFAVADVGEHHDAGLPGLVVENAFLLVFLVLVLLLPARSVVEGARLRA